MGLASINIRFTTNLSEFSTAMQNQSRQIQKLGGQMQSFGQGLTIGLTAPIVAFGVASVIAFDESAQAIAQVDAALKSTGGSVGYTSGELQKMAADLQNITTFDDDEILKKATANLLTFSKITGDTFQQAQKAALDLSTRLDGDLQGAAIQVGKALNDPIKGITALSRVGVSFSEGQKATIKSMVETNNLAGAQSVILAELQKEFGGSAEAAAKAGLGGFKQLGNIIGDLSEDFGKIIVEAMQPFIDVIKSVVIYLKELSPEAKTTIAVVAGIAAVIGPLTLGIGALISLLPTLAAGFAVLTGPIGLTVAALAAVAYVVANNWGVVKQTLVDVANYFIDLYNSSTVFRGGVEAVALSFKILWTQVKTAFNNIKAIAEFTVKNIFNYFSSLGKLIKAVLTFDVAGIKASFKEAFGGAKENVESLYSNIKKNNAEAAKEIKTNIGTALTNTLNGKKLPKIKIEKESVDAKGVSDSIAEGMESGAIEGAKKAKEKLDGLNVNFKTVDAPKGTQSSYDAEIAKLKEFQQTIATTPEQVKMAEEAIKQVEFSKALKFDPTSLITISGGFDAMVDKMQATANRLKSVGEETKTTVFDISQVLSASIEALSEGAAVSFGEAIGNMISGAGDLGDFMGSMLGLISDFMKDLGKQLVALGIARIALDKIWVSGPAALAAGVALIALASVVGQSFKSGPKFANGGIVGGSFFYGDKILARVNSGEMVANSEQQKRIWGAMSGSSKNVNVVLGGGFEIEGSKLRLVLDRSDNKNNRMR